jgi:phosphatidylglycerophosphate synthase
MESLKQLRKICQKPNYKKVGNWMARNIVRDAALPFTWLFLHTPITANQVTAVSIVVIIIAAWFFACGTVVTFFIGAVLLQFWYLLDHIDGQIARYRKQESITGVFMDYISHYFPHLLIFPFMSIGLFKKIPNINYIYLGIIGGAFLVLINLIYDSKYKSFFWAVSKYSYNKIEMESFRESQTKRIKGSRLGFAWLYKLCEIHIIINILFFVSILFFIPGMDFKNGIKFLIMFYALLSVFVFVLKFAYFILTKRIESDFYAVFKK